MAKYQRGFIGKKERDLAIVELESNSWRKDKNLFINANMNGRIISCWWYTNIEELLSENEYLDTFVSLKEYKEFMFEMNEDFKDEDLDEKILTILDDKKIAYRASCGNSGQEYIDYNKDIAIKNLIKLDKDCSFYAYSKAMDNLKGDFKKLNEDLVIALLS